MIASLLCAAALAGAGFTATSIDDGRRIVLSSTRPVADSAEVRCRWTLYRNGLPAASGWWDVSELGADSPITNTPPSALRQMEKLGGDFALRVRFVTGEEDVNDETLLSVWQVDYPRVDACPFPVYVGMPAVKTETPQTYEFKTPSTRIRFDRGTGLLSGFATGWWSLTEWMKRPMAFDFGDPSPRIRLETFSNPVETNGVWMFTTVSWWSLGSGAAKTNFEIRVSTDWQVRGDGRVIARTAVRPFGLRHVLPRVGWAFVLAPSDLLVQYYGAGPAADAPDRSHEGLTGIYEASVKGCGAHAETRAVSFDAGSDHLGFATLGDNFYLEIGETPSKASFCGLVAARDALSDRDFQIDLLISPEKTLQAYK